MNQEDSTRKQPRLAKIYFRLESDAWHGHLTESLWADDLGGGRYRLRNSPFFACGVSNEDVVFGKREDGKIFFDSASIRGGHSTYRLLVPNDVTPQAFAASWKPIEEQGCSFEEMHRAKMRLYTVDVPSSSNIDTVYALLEKGLEAMVWDFEEAHCGHSLKQAGGQIP